MATIVTRSGKGSALTHTEMDANFTNLNTDKIESTLAADLDTKNFAIKSTGTNGYIDIDTKVQFDNSVADYPITIDNQDNSGLGLRIKAGNSDSGTYGSLAILSVADKDNDLKLIAKASGEVVVYHELTVHDVIINSPTTGNMQISTLTSGENINITTNGGTLSLNSIDFPGSDGSANQILKTNGSGALSFVNASDVALTSVVDDTSPELGSELDQNGNRIQDDSRNYQILGNIDPTRPPFDSFNNTARVHGVVNVAEIDGPTNRVHSNPTLTIVTADADVSGSANAGRLRMNYFEGVYEMDGFDNTTTGFGKGHNGMFVSSMAKNSNTSNNASTLSEQTGMTITPQVASTSTGGLTVTDLRCIDMNPNINDTNGTVTTLYGLYYNTSNAGTITNQYSFYGAESTASSYNQGGFELPSFTVAQLEDTVTVNCTRRTGNTAFCTNETGGAVPVFFDGSDWRRSTDRAVIST